MGSLLARELHDSVAQTLSTMLIELDLFRASQYGRTGVLQQVDQFEESTRAALSDLRRLLVELRAQQPREEDLVKLVRLGMLERQGREPEIDFGLQVAADWPELIPAAAALELYRIAAEAMDNGIRHGGAKKIEVALGLDLGGNLAAMTIRDDGRGLPRQLQSGQQVGLGILGMQERAALLGGEVVLESRVDDRGTTVRVTVPLAAFDRGRTGP